MVRLTHGSILGVSFEPVGDMLAGEKFSTAARTYYVNVGSGSDSNDGLSSGAAFATINKALDVVWYELDIASYDVTIQLAAGTYDENIFREGRHVGEGRVSIIGDETTPANVIVSPTSGNAFQCYHSAWLIVRGVKIEATGASGRGVYAAWHGMIYLYNVDFGACSGYHMRASKGAIWILSDYTISGNSAVHWSAHSMGVIYCVGLHNHADREPRPFLTRLPSLKRLGVLLHHKTRFPDLRLASGSILGTHQQ